MTVLIVTYKNDNTCIESVASSIAELGGRSFRFDTDLFPTEVQVELGSRRAIRSRAGELDLRDVTAVWYRRVSYGAAIPSTLEPDLRNGALGEVRRTCEGLLASLRVPHVDPVVAIRNAEHKQLQLDLAEEVGLAIPRSLTTNDPEAVRAFAASCPAGVVMKMLSSFAVHREGREMVVFTTALGPDDLADLRGLELSPATFQEKIPKERELRVTVVGDRVFSASIDPSAVAGAADDWRRRGIELVEAWQPDKLPAEVEAGVLRLMDRLGLNYGAIDIIRTPDGRHVFLEVNPSGEFFWLEQAPGLPIGRALAEVLLGKARRRGSWDALLRGEALPAA